MSKTSDLREKIFDFITDPPCKGCKYWDVDGHHCFVNSSRDENIKSCQIIDNIFEECKKAGLKFVDKDSILLLPAGGAASNDGYWAKDVGMSWERSAPMYEAFYNAGYRQFEEIEL